MTENQAFEWLLRLKKGLSNTSAKLANPISNAFTKRRLDEQALEELEELLIKSDLGVSLSTRIVQKLSITRFDKEVSADEIRDTLAEEIEEQLKPVAKPLNFNPQLKPHVILMCGVNGSGKTTSIGKLASHYKTKKLSVMLAACDTFRAAATEQLQIWGDRTGSSVYSSSEGSDAAAIAYDAFSKAKIEKVDVLLIDTAGRLQNKKDLMAELKKIIRVIQKIDETAPHNCLLILDASTGQNAISQVQIFRELVDINGLIITKLDGTARGGIVVAIAEEFGLPVHAIGVGEGVEDLQPFEARDFSRSLLSLN